MNAVVAFPSNRHPGMGPVLSGGPQAAPRPDAVRHQLTKILQSAGFIHSGRMRRFLEFVVEEMLRGRAHQLCEYSVGVSVFDRDQSFEPGLDPIVRNDARRLRSKLLEYYQRATDTQRDPIFIDIPKGGYVPTFRYVAACNEEEPAAEYRLCLRLVRTVDGSEILSKQYDLEGGMCSLDLKLGAVEDSCGVSVVSARTDVDRACATGATPRSGRRLVRVRSAKSARFHSRQARRE